MKKLITLSLLSGALFFTACGDDDKKDDDKGKDKTENEAEADIQDIVCDCVDGFLSGDMSPEEMEACQALEEDYSDEELEEMAMNCEGAQEIMDMADDMEDMNIDDYEGDPDADCDQLLADYEELAESTYEIAQKMKDDPSNTAAITNYTEIVSKAGQLSQDIIASDCYQDEDFQARMEEIADKYEDQK